MKKKFSLYETNWAKSNVIIFLVMSSRLLQLFKSIQGAPWEENMYTNEEELEHWELLPAGWLRWIKKKKKMYIETWQELKLES